MRCAIEEKEEETDTLRDNLNGFWNVERVRSSGELVINKLEKDIWQDAKRYIKYSSSNLSIICLSHNCNFCEILLNDLSKLLAGKNLIREQNVALKECKNNTNNESVPNTKMCKLHRSFLTFHAD